MEEHPAEHATAVASPPARDGSGGLPQSPGEPPGEPAIWSRNFRYYFVARSAGLLSWAMLPVAVAAGLLIDGYGLDAAGYSMAFLVAPFAGLVLFGGVLADRFTARRMMIVADLANLAAHILLALLFLHGIDHLWQLYALLVVAGTANALFQPGASSTVPLVSRDVQGANGVLRTSEAITGLGGPALAGVLVGFGSTGWVMVISAAAYGTSAVCLYVLRLGAVPAPPPGESLWRNLAVGWREFRARSWLWGVIVIWMFYAVLSWGPQLSVAAGVIVLEHGARSFGLINAALGAGTVIGGLLAIRYKPERPLAAGAVAMLAYPLYPLGIVLGLPVWVLAAAQVVVGAGIGVWGVMWATSVQTQVPGEMLNRIHAYEVAGSVGMYPIGSALAGPAVGAFGTDQVLLTGVVVSFLTATALLAARPIRTLRRVPDRR
ncbi:MFS transporter [Streptomyces sp. CAI-121]|uniref:MFS transporter n=1 Tax=unclassified Streptomyces TaxID=2593676 RepID=UPI001587C3B2|nr:MULTISPECIES: MFS transporter [unclassified Streptomyces]NUV67282.1 MFS transporter [Streptomyces sp. CAI-121]NUW13400.1 MFS transporter [Streptomyces sp. CAI-68]